MSGPKERYLEAKEIRDSGKYLGIPLHLAYNKLGMYLPSIPDGKQIMITASSGAGKSHTWIGLLLYTVYKLCKNHNIKVKFLIVLLEDPKEFFEDRLFSRVLYEETGHRVAPETLNGYSSTVLSDKVVQHFDKVGSIVRDIIDNYCIVTDSTYNPTGIYKWFRNQSELLGTHVWEEKEFTSSDNNVKVTKKVNVYSHYVKSDPDLHILGFVDNLNNLAEEMGKGGKMLDQRQSINRWTRDYARLQITKHWGFSIVNIMQQAAETEKKQFTNSGTNIISKLEPSLNGLGNSKECQRDHHLILGVFGPDRYDIEVYKDYDITKTRDNFRAVSILKNNFGTPNKKIAFYFDGACSVWKELPKPDEMTEEIYKQIINNTYERTNS